MKKISAVSFLSVLFVVLLSVFCIQPAEAGQAVSKLRAKTETGYINKNGNVYLTVKCEEMKAAGYEYGDIVKVKFLGKKLKIPFVSAYSDVDTGKAALLAREQDEYVMLAINMGDFASTYGIGVKTVHEDGTVVWDYAEGVTGSVKMYISLRMIFSM